MEELRIVRAALLVLAAVLLASCTERTSEAKAFVSAVGPTSLVAPTTSDGRVVLVTIDGARWQDVFGGSDPSRSGLPRVPPGELMPRVYAMLATRGVAFGADREGCGTVHTASGANVSLPGYQEIFTGRPSWCLDNNCDGVSESVLDEAALAKVAGVASIGSWDVLDRAVSGGGVGVFVAAGRAWPAGAPTGASLGSATLDGLASAGEIADPFPGHDGYRPDAQTAAIALEYFRTAKPAFFHVGLGDTDEWGHRDDYGAYLVALRHADALIGELADVLETMGDEGAKTTILVTPDHGRNSDFRDHGTLCIESGRTFLLAFGARVTARGIGCPSGDITLADIAPTIRVLLGLPRDAGEGAGAAVNRAASSSSTSSWASTSVPRPGFASGLSSRRRSVDSRALRSMASRPVTSTPCSTGGGCSGSVGPTTFEGNDAAAVIRRAGGLAQEKRDRRARSAALRRLTYMDRTQELRSASRSRAWRPITTRWSGRSSRPATAPSSLRHT